MYVYSFFFIFSSEQTESGYHNSILGTINIAATASRTLDGFATDVFHSSKKIAS
jgi:hypothetical protein